MIIKPAYYSMEKAKNKMPGHTSMVINSEGFSFSFNLRYVLPEEVLDIYLTGLSKVKHRTYDIKEDIEVHYTLDLPFSFKNLGLEVYDVLWDMTFIKLSVVKKLNIENRKDLSVDLGNAQVLISSLRYFIVKTSKNYPDIILPTLPHENYSIQIKIT